MPIEIKIPGIGNGILKFTKDSISYKNSTLKYSEITHISCRMEFISHTFLPNEGIVSFTFFSKTKKIDVGFTTSVTVTAKEATEILTQIFSITKSVMVPLILKDLVKRIVDDGETVKIGHISFDKEGYSIKKLFRKDDKVLWTGNLIEPKLIQGRYVLFRPKNDNFVYFTECSLENPNVILIPELLQTLHCK